MLAFGAIAAGILAAAAPAQEPAEGPSVDAASEQLDEPSEKLQWRAPAGCPDASTLRRRIEAYLVAPSPDGSVDAEADRKMGASRPMLPGTRGRIDLVPGGYELTLWVRDERRSLTGEDCHRLTDAAALIIAVAMDPVAAAVTLMTEPTKPPPEDTTVQRPLEPDVPPPSEPPPPRRDGVELVEPSEARVADTERPPTRRAPVRLTFSVRPRLGIGGNVLPSVGVALGAAVLLRGARPWRAEVDGSFWFPRTVDVDPEAGAGARLWLGEAGARGCFEPRRRQLFGLICGGGRLGGLGGRGLGAGIQTRRDVQLWAAGTLSAGLGWSPAPRFSVVLEAEALVSLRRPGFHLDGLGSIHRAGLLAGRGFVGFEIALP